MSCLLSASFSNCLFMSDYVLKIIFYTKFHLQHFMKGKSFFWNFNIGSTHPKMVSESQQAPIDQHTKILHPNWLRILNGDFLPWRLRFFLSLAFASSMRSFWFTCLFCEFHMWFNVHIQSIMLNFGFQLLVDLEQDISI